WHLQVASAQGVGGGPVVHAGQLHHDDPVGLLPAPLDPPAGAVEEELGARGEALGEVRQGKHLDGSLDPEPADDLPHADHGSRSYLPVARSTNTRLRSRSEATRTSVRSASMLRPALPISRPMSSSAIRTLMATVPRPRSSEITSTSAGLSATERAT